MDSVFLNIDKLVVCLSGKDILNDISLTIGPGEQWAIYGEAGAGKTVFAHAIAGRCGYHGQLKFLDEKGNEVRGTVAVVDHQHRFRDLQNQSNFYYQQRYNAFDSETTQTVKQDLEYYEQSVNRAFPFHELIDKFHLNALLDEPLIQLSNGENKRLQILKALLLSPSLLILDEPYTGLDTEGRNLLDEILFTLSKTGQAMILFSSRNYVPSWINRFGRLEKGQLILKSDANDISLQETAEGLFSNKRFPDRFQVYPDFEFAIRMRDVQVRYGEKKILNGIKWEVRKGECWSLTGHNGAGKSTLLSLLTGDNPQAYANEIYLFDRRRGTGESIWDIKQKIGFLSPELQLHFDQAATAFTTLASGFFDTIGLFRKLTFEQEVLIYKWLEFIGCTAHQDRLLNTLPAGIQRLLMLGRAMIKTPALLILDEPCQGLDTAQTGHALNLIDAYCERFGSALIFVSHYEHDFPSCIRHKLLLKQGRIS